MESELLARLEALGVDIEAHEEDIKRDANGCNCDVDYQCLNVECRESNENYARPWRRS